MTLADLNLVWPELILGIGALALLMVGAFRGKGGAVFDGLAMLVLLAFVGLMTSGPPGLWTRTALTIVFGLLRTGSL